MGSIFVKKRVAKESVPALEPKRPIIGLPLPVQFAMEKLLLKRKLVAVVLLPVLQTLKSLREPNATAVALLPLASMGQA